MEIFQTKVLQEVVNFKWDRYAFRWHFTLWIIHQTYLALIFAYTYNTYVYPSEEYESGLNWALCGMIIVPFLYECLQIYMSGPLDYFTDMGNLVDICFIGCAVAMSFVH
jgi:hypothetical protein